MDQSVKSYLDKYNVQDATRDAISARQQMYINGVFTDGEASGTAAVIEPSTGGHLTEILTGSTADIDNAIAAARHAFEEGPWATMSPAERQGILLRLADLVEQHAQVLAEIETIDNGKSIGPCMDLDIMGSADLIRHMAGFATKIEGVTREVSLPGDFFAYSLREPVGVVGAIVPWNWPLNMAMWKCAAPLAAGCTLVVKPAELTSLSMLYFARLAEEAGVPPGVLNVVTGKGSVVGSHLAGHPGIDKISFTGSTEVGRLVGHAAVENFTQSTLELGGKSPMVAFEDADPEAVAEGARWSIFLNAGQNCSAGSRLYLHKSIYDQGIEAMIAQAESLNVTEGLDPTSDMGPVITEADQNRILGLIDQASAQAGEVVTGGKRPDGPGFFVPPTVIAMTDNKADLVQEEIFGPVLVVLPFDDDAKALEMANDNQYGLAASVWTKDVSRAHRASRALRAGTVWINTHDMIDSATPFGGVKNSGIGKDLGREQFESVLKSKTVTMML